MTTPQDIWRTARLARIHIDESEIPAYINHFNNLLTLADEMSSVDTENIEPMAHPMEGQHQRTRNDYAIPIEADQLERFQAIAPEVAENLYIVPKVIEENILSEDNE